MDPFSIFLAIPKAALFLLVIVGGAIAAEIFYFSQKKEDKTPEVSLPPTPPPPAGEVPTAETLPTPPATTKFTTQVVQPETRRPSKKTVATVFILLFLALSIPAAIILVRQRQEIRKEAYGEPCQNDSDCPSGLTCDYNTCKSCSDFSGDEARCWTHGVTCYYDNGSCLVKPPTTTPGPGGGIECGATSVRNTTQNTINCEGSGFSCAQARSSRADCEANPFCGGASSHISFSLGPGQSHAVGNNSIACGVWQVDYTITCTGGLSCSGGGNGCNWGATCEGGSPPPSGSPPTFSAQCLATGVFDHNWSPITDLSTLTGGEIVFLATHGSTNEPQGITKARFRINDTADASWCNGSGNTLAGGWCETTNTHGSDFFVQFTIPANGSFNIKSMVFNPSLDWH